VGKKDNLEKQLDTVQKEIGKLKLFKQTNVKELLFTLIAEQIEFKKDYNNELDMVLSMLLLARKRNREKKRKKFSNLVKNDVLTKQNNRCNLCLKLLELPDFHHVDGNCSNNDFSNCEALCPNCHANKTRKKA